MNPFRVVLDTNVVISAFLFGGHPRRVIESILDGRSQGFVSLAILDEIRDVLRRPKFGLTPDQVLAVVEEFRALCEVVTPGDVVEVMEDDPDDNRILECALAADAQFIISGDAPLLDLVRWQDVSILSPGDYMGRLNRM
ncbi:MAG: putative toxin-antitoxin system toxin component, PIN family [Verrucomicrobia bacterium]|nr:putative toxin-antitoxin system toxin component, PIN family [Verrucomicrobiota bacterium]